MNTATINGRGTSPVRIPQNANTSAAAPNTTESELDALRRQLAAANAKLEAKQPKVSFKVSEKGGLSVYGLGRFPVTLYKSQWLKLIGLGDAIKQFISDNDASLTSKD